MPRKSLPAATHVGPEVPATAPAESREEQAKFAAHQRHLAVVDEQFGIGIPYDRDVYVARGQMIVADIGARALELGRICVSLKEHEPPGDYYAALDRIGVAPRFAQKCVAAALKFDGSEAKQVVAGRLSSAKLLELVAEDDDRIEQLVDGGVLAGLTLDEIERMSTKQLREALRRERKERADEQSSFEEQLERKDKRMNALERKARAVAKSPIREKAELILGEIDRLVSEAMNLHTEISNALAELKEAHKEAGARIDPDMGLRLSSSREVFELQLGKLVKQF